MRQNARVMIDDNFERDGAICGRGLIGPESLAVAEAARSFPVSRPAQSLGLFGSDVGKEPDRRVGR